MKLANPAERHGLASLLNSAEWDGQRAKKNRERQCPEAEPDFQGGPRGTAGDEPDDASEGHACTASGSGEFVGVSPAMNERHEIERASCRERV